ncbi:CEI_1a_G0000690.mRNA.1.CDS.1 [Saccharomyces cerevisiae]|nr:EM14S01-3B_G0048800.mRNA.1.CDS.1 [Saccharomyces cerevisiae]CAI4241166.1 AMH_1a_G0000790.mRNA.1.CDS.1 [Saccharomyces cerevisiae]CAI4244524.1 CEI_1a_G0000690.mRNA.1.CDS.1 [Saccharomyces cerevisiae]CAI6472654.1 AMH_1a_G0000790.mRNA.1.CDS.1 [Saccharomyces cerevisiae]CAI7127795.1 CEI_1a_G0000690.mRNA.1.CDS.1 [Saccharomyces cerevisiae]
MNSSLPLLINCPHKNLEVRRTGKRLYYRGIVEPSTVLGIHLKGCWMLNLAKVFFSSLLGLLKSEIVERHSKDKSTISINGTVERVTYLKLAWLSNIIISGKELGSRVYLFLYLRCWNILLLGSDYCLHIHSEGMMSKIFELIKRTSFTLARLM